MRPMLNTQEIALYKTCEGYDTLTCEQALRVIHYTVGVDTTFRLAQNGQLVSYIRKMLDIVYNGINTGFCLTEANDLVKLYLLEFKHNVKHVNLKPKQHHEP